MTYVGESLWLRHIAKVWSVEVQVWKLGLAGGGWKYML